MISFATPCGVLLPTGACPNESEQYSTLPTCRCCGEKVCPEHAAPGSLQESDRDIEGDGDHGPVAVHSETVICTVCAAEEAVAA